MFPLKKVLSEHCTSINLDCYLQIKKAISFLLLFVCITIISEYLSENCKLEVPR